MAGIYYRRWYSQVIEIQLMNYFSLASKIFKLECNKAFWAEIIHVLYLIRKRETI